MVVSIIEAQTEYNIQYILLYFAFIYISMNTIPFRLLSQLTGHAAAVPLAATL
jgi:hypothetical protein